MAPLRLLTAFRDAAFDYTPRRHFWSDAPSVIRLAVNVLVLEGPDGLVIFDPGPGDPNGWIQGLDEENARMHFTAQGGLQSFLSTHGGAEAVSDIYLTHTHPDHCLALFSCCGAHLKTFPCARVKVADAEGLKRYSREYLGDGNAYLVLAPDAIENQQCNAHAKDHTVFRLETSEGPLVVWGDLLPTAMHLREKFQKVLVPGDQPEFFRDWLDWSCDQNALNFLFHDPRRRLCRLERDGERFKATPHDLIGEY